MKSLPIWRIGILILLIAAVRHSGLAQAPTPARTDSVVTRDSLEVSVVAAIVVEKDGRISKVDIVESSCRKCSKSLKKSIEKEVLRIVRATPRMEPRKDKKGKPQVTYYKQPIVFKIASEEEADK
jgi:hypothetical protein